MLDGLLDFLLVQVRSSFNRRACFNVRCELWFPAADCDYFYGKLPPTSMSHHGQFLTKGLARQGSSLAIQLYCMSSHKCRPNPVTFWVMLVYLQRFIYSRKLTRTVEVINSSRKTSHVGFQLVSLIRPEESVISLRRVAVSLPHGGPPFFGCLWLGLRYNCSYLTNSMEETLLD